jgi:hypothetical protein
MTSAVLPVSWRPSLAALLPANPATYDGPRLATWLAMAYLVFITVRSMIHLFLPDGGAQSIATIDVHVAGGSNIVAMFGQWGAIQLLLAGLLWVLLLRWRGLTPLVLLVFAIEPNWWVFPVLVLLLLMSLCPAKEEFARHR